MDTEQGYHLTVDVFDDATGRIILHDGKVVTPLYLTDEERRELIAHLWHKDDDEKAHQHLQQLAEQKVQHDTFKLLTFRGRKHDRDPTIR